MNNDDHDATCSCCGGDAATGGKPVQFETQFQYYIVTPIDPGAAPTGDEAVHAATNSSATARMVLNMLAASGVQTSGWDNEKLTWFLTPEIMQAMQMQGSKPGASRPH